MAISSHRQVRRSRHRRHTVFFDLTDTADERFDRVIEALLILVLVFAPLAMGAVQRWSELVVFALTALMAMCLGLKLLARPDIRFVWSWTYLPVALFVGLTAIQLSRFSQGAIRLLSPGTIELKRSLLAVLEKSGVNDGSSMTLSFYPEATAANLRLLLAAATIYVVTVNVVRRAGQVRRVMVAVAVIGAAVALIEMMHLASGAKQFYWMFGETRPGWPVAPFKNPNHLGQYLNLALGAAMALMLIQVEQAVREYRRQSSAPDETPLPYITPATWALGAAIVLMAVGVFLSLSRGAMLSLLLSAGWAAIVIARGRREASGAQWIFVPLGWLVLLLVIFFGFDQLTARLRDASRVDSMSTQGRLQIVSDVMSAWKSFPLLGTGMGTFEVVYPMFDRSTTASLASHAENEYAQALLEGGAIGLAIVLAFAAMIGRKYAVCLRSAPSPMSSLAAGLGFGLIAAMLQSLTDFGQHMPAIAMLSAVCCALLVTLSQASRQTSAMAEPASRRSKRRLTRRMRGPVTCIVAVAWAWVLFDAVSAARAEWFWAQARPLEARLVQHDWAGSDDEYARLIIAAAKAAALRPQDVHYRHWLNNYRWKLLSRRRDSATGQIELTGQQVEWASRVAGELESGLGMCPTYGPSYLLAGQIRQSILDDPQAGAALIQTGWRLSRADPLANFEAGMLDAHEGNWGAAMAKFRHAAELSAAYLNDGADAVVRRFRRPDLAVQLANGDIPAMRTIVRALLETDQRVAAADAAAKLAELIKSAAAPPNAPEAALIEAARLAMDQHDYSAAAGYYHRALNLNLARADLHLELARALAGQGQIQEAISEALTAEQLGSGEAESYILELRQRPTTIPASAPYK